MSNEPSFMMVEMPYKVFLPYVTGVDKDSVDNEMPFHWFCWKRSEKGFKGNVDYDTKEFGSNMMFEKKEDMDYFILMWGEYLK